MTSTLCAIIFYLIALEIIKKGKIVMILFKMKKRKIKLRVEMEKEKKIV